MYTFCNSLPVPGKPEEEQETQIVDIDHNHCNCYDVFHLDLKILINKTQADFSFGAKMSQRWFNCTLFILKKDLHKFLCYSTLSVHLINFLSFSQVVCCYILLICLCELNINQVILKLNIQAYANYVTVLF